jgi:hypothetical protein
MKYITTALIVFLTSLVFSQAAFLPNIGTKWRYSFGRYFSQIKDNYTVEYIKDSLYNGETTKVVSTKIMYLYCNGDVSEKKVLLKQRNDSVWFLHSKTQNTWQLLINYSASPGQSWTFVARNVENVSNTHKVFVNSIGSTTISNIPLKTMNVTYSVNGVFTFTSTIYERFADIFFLFPLYNSNLSGPCDLDYAEITLCYQDNQIGVIQFNAAYFCDYSNLVDIKEIEISGDYLNLFPVPTGDKLELTIKEGELHARFNTVMIFNALGQEVSRQDIAFQNSSVIIGTEKLPNGIYLLSLMGDSRESINKRFIVKH